MMLSTVKRPSPLNDTLAGSFSSRLTSSKPSLSISIFFWAEAVFMMIHGKPSYGGQRDSISDLWHQRPTAVESWYVGRWKTSCHGGALVGSRRPFLLLSVYSLRYMHHCFLRQHAAPNVHDAGWAVFAVDGIESRWSESTVGEMLLRSLSSDFGQVRQCYLRNVDIQLHGNKEGNAQRNLNLNVKFRIETLQTFPIFNFRWCFALQMCQKPE